MFRPVSNQRRLGIWVSCNLVSFLSYVGVNLSCSEGYLLLIFFEVGRHQCYPRIYRRFDGTVCFALCLPFPLSACLIPSCRAHCPVQTPTPGPSQIPCSPVRPRDRVFVPQRPHQPGQTSIELSSVPPMAEEPEVIPEEARTCGQ